MKKLRLILLCCFFLSAFLIIQCDKNDLKKDKISDFNFPELNNIDQDVYNTIKQTCAIYWDLNEMIDGTFKIIKDNNEYAVHCDGYLDGELYEFVIRVDKNGEWINDGRSLKISE